MLLHPHVPNVLCFNEGFWQGGSECEKMIILFPVAILCNGLFRFLLFHQFHPLIKRYQEVATMVWTVAFEHGTIVMIILEIYNGN